MKKTMILLVFLILTLGYSVSYAQNSGYQSTYDHIRSTAIVSSPTPNKYSGIETTIAVNLLIISVYVLYWFKQKP